MKNFLVLALLGLSLSTVSLAASCPKGSVTSHKYISNGSNWYRIYFCRSDDALNPPPYSPLLKKIFNKTDFVTSPLFSLGNASASISLADAFNGAVISKNNQVYEHKDNPQAYLPTGTFSNATWNQPIIYNFYSRRSSQQMVNYLRQHASIFKANAGTGNESEGQSLARYDYDIAIIKDAKFFHIEDNTKFLLGDIKFYWSQRFGNTHGGYLHHAGTQGGTVYGYQHLGVLTEIELKIGDGYEIKKSGDYAVSVTVDTVN